MSPNIGTGIGPDIGPDNSPDIGSDNGTETDAECSHDWQVVNHDENRDVYKCTKCGALKRE